MEENSNLHKSFKTQHSIPQNVLLRLSFGILGILSCTIMITLLHANSVSEPIYTAVSCPLQLVVKPISIVDQSKEFAIDYMFENDEYMLDYSFSLDNLGYDFNDVVYVGFSLLGESPSSLDEALTKRRIEGINFSGTHHIEINISELLNSTDAITAWNELLSHDRDYLVVSASFYYPNGTISMVYNDIMTLDSFNKRSTVYE